MSREKFFKAIVFSFFFSTALFSEVRFVGKIPNPNEYYLFATSGWTGNWYIGPDHCWIQEFSTGEIESGVRVFIGAKIGRAKRNSEILKALGYFDKLREIRKKEKLKDKKDEVEKLKKEVKEIEERVLKKDKYIYIGITDDINSWDRKYKLIENSLIPLEGSYVEAIDGVGEARWFWVEVPEDTILNKEKIYIAVWSDYQEFKSVEKAPILAAAWGDSKKDSWVSSIKEGYPDFSTRKDINFFEPAIGLKLIKGEKEPISVKIKSYEYKKDPEKKDRYILRVYLDIKGRDITRFNLLRKTEDRFVYFGFFFYNPPYIITVKDLEEGIYLIKASVKNWQENTGESELKEIEIKEKK